MSLMPPPSSEPAAADAATAAASPRTPAAAVAAGAAEGAARGTALMDKLRRVQRVMLYCSVPLWLVAMLAAWMLHEVEPRTFHIVKWLEAGAVRAVLRSQGLREVEESWKATILWTDADTPLFGQKRVAGQRVSALSRSIASGRPDAVCRILRDASARVASAPATAAAADAEGSASRPPRACACHVLPAEAAELREAMVASAKTAAGTWELSPVDNAAKIALEVAAAAGAPLPSHTNNPASLPIASQGQWAARRPVARPLLLADGRRFALQLFAAVPGDSPLRVYLHQEGVLWRAPRKFEVGRAHEPSSHAAGPRALRVGRDATPLSSGELRPMGALWAAIAHRGNASLPARVWRSLERASLFAVLAALPVLPPGGDAGGGGGGGGGFFSSIGARRPTYASGHSKAFGLWSVRLELDDELVPHVVAIEPTPELPDGLPSPNGLAGEGGVETQPAWHRAVMARVASDVLNLTGATLHPARKTLYLELREQLYRSLSARRKKAMRQSKISRQRQKRAGVPRAKGPRGGKDGRGAKREKSPAGRGAQRGGADEEVGCALALPAATEEAREAAGGDALPAEPLCIEQADIDALSLTDTEWYWRFGFRRLHPGADDDLALALRGQQRRADKLLSHYLTRWPKVEEGFAVAEGVRRLAEMVEEEAA